MNLSNMDQLFTTHFMFEMQIKDLVERGRERLITLKKHLEGFYNILL